MVPDRQKVQTHGHRHNYIPPTLSRDNKRISVFRVTSLKILGRVGTHIFFIIFFQENLKFR